MTVKSEALFGAVYSVTDREKILQYVSCKLVYLQVNLTKEL